MKNVSSLTFANANRGTGSLVHGLGWRREVDSEKRLVLQVGAGSSGRVLLAVFACVPFGGVLARLVTLAAAVFVAAGTLGAASASTDDDFVERRGCCSHHQGVCGCENGRAKCC